MTGTGRVKNHFCHFFVTVYLFGKGNDFSSPFAFDIIAYHSPNLFCRLFCKDFKCHAAIVIELCTQNAHAGKPEQPRKGIVPFSSLILPDFPKFLFLKII